MLLFSAFKQRKINFDNIILNMPYAFYHFTQTAIFSREHQVERSVLGVNLFLLNVTP